MKKYVFWAVYLVAASAIAAPFTNVTTKTEGKTGLKTLGVIINGNNSVAETRIAALESAGVGGTLATAKIIVGSATSNATAVSMSGGATIATNGTVTVNLSSASTTGVVSVAKGGTGAETLTDGGILLGSGTGEITALGAASNGQIPIGDGTTDPVLATITGTSQEIGVANGAGSITISLGSTYNKTNTFITQPAADVFVTNVVTILKGQITAWTTNGVSI